MADPIGTVNVGGYTNDDISSAVTSYLGERNNQTSQNIKINIGNALKSDPDYEVELRKVSDKLGIPVDSVRANRDDTQRQVVMQSTDFGNLTTQYPNTAKFFLDQEKARIAHDDITNMSSLEKSASYLGRSALSGVVTLGAVTTKLLDKFQPFTTSDEEASVLFKDNPAALKKFREDSAAGFLSRWTRQQTDYASSIMQNMPDEVKKEFGNKEYFTADPNNSALLSPTKLTGDLLNSLPTTAALALSIYFTRSAAGSTMETMVASGATKEAARAAAIKSASETMAKVGGASEGLVGYAQQGNQTQADVLKLSQAELEKSPKYQELVTVQGYSPEAARVYLAAFTGEQSGTMAGIVDAVTSYFGGKYLGKIIGEGGALAPRVGKGFVNESLTEGVQSGGEKFVENLAIKNNVNPNQSLSDGVLESTAQGLTLGGIMGGGFAAIGGRQISGMEKNVDKAANANLAFNILNQINDLAEASKLRTRDVSTFQGFMKSSTEDSPVDTVFIDPKTLTATLNQAKVDPASLGIEGLTQNIEQAISTGSDVGISVADFASKMAGQDYSQSLLPHLKTDPVGMSQVQAQEFMQNNGEKLKEEIAKQLETHMGDQTFKESADKVQAQVLDQLTAVNRFTPDVNNAYAAMMSNFYAVSAAKLGITPEEMAARYPIRIQAESITGENQYGQSATLRSGKESLKKFGIDKTQTNNTRDIAAALQSRQRAKYGLIAKDDRSPEGMKQIAKWMTEEVMFEMEHPENSGVGWYSTKFQSALDTMGEIFPELKSDQGARDTMTALIAITSDGQKVMGNTLQAMDIYSNFRKDGTTEGKFTTSKGHQRQASIDGNLKVLQGLYDKLGAEGMREFLMQEKTIKELNAIQKESGKKELSTGYTVDVKMPMAVVALGEKLGAFYANLMGAHGYLTMDRWWSRTFNRYRGTILTAPNEQGMRNFAELVGKPEMSNDEVLSAIVAPHDALEKRGFKTQLAQMVGKSEPSKTNEKAAWMAAAKKKAGKNFEALYQEHKVERAANTLYKMAFVNLEDAPFNATDRGFMLDATNMAQKMLAKKGKDLSIADIQAILWYYEKKLYGELGARQSGKISYEEAAKRFVSARESGLDIQQLESSGSDGLAGQNGSGLLAEEDFDSGGEYNQSTLGNLNQGEGERGAISFGTDITQTPSIITLLSGADLSTFLHESGHFFLEVTADIALRPDAPVDIQEDMNRLLSWFGVENIETWRDMSIEQKRPFHEKFARGFEAYLFEGNAPTPELASIFQRFRAWLLNVYKAIGQLNVELNDDVRSVFDRMIASTEQIQQAEDANAYAPLFKNKPDFMSDDEWVAYQKSDIDASQDAISALEQRSLRDMQWLTNAKNKLLKALQKENAEKRKAVRQEVSSEVMSQPVYRIMEYLKRGTLDGSPAENAEKISAKALEEIYGGEGDPYALFDWSVLGYGKYGMLSKEGGIHPDLIANLPGSTFSSGDQLVKALTSAENMSELIERTTDERMLARYGDINSPQALDKVVNEAIHNQARAKFVATEANALAKVTGRPQILAQAAKQFANDMIARLKIRNIKPGQYSSAEVRSAKAAEAARAKGNLIEAATEKRNQLINNYATKAALDAQQEIEKALRYLKKFENQGTRKNLDIDYLEQIDGLLARFDLRQGTTLRQIDKRKTLAAWVESQQNAGKEPMIPDELMDESKLMSYKEMTLEEFRGLVDAIRNIDHLGRLKNKLLKLQDQREFNEVVDEAVDTINAYALKDVVQKIETNTWYDNTSAGARSFFAMHRKFASLIRQMDGFRDGGKLWDIFVRPLNEAATTEAKMREQATMALHELFKPILKSGGLKNKLLIPEIGQSLSLEGRLAIALNLGNETNLRRIMDGEGWSFDQVNAIVKSLTAEQWNFVQGTWNYINSYWSEISAKERRVTGVIPEKVEARPFVVTSSDGVKINLEGGYYPIKYNPDRSNRSAADDAAEIKKQMERGLYSKAATKQGHLKSRVESVGRPMRYDFGVIFQHVDQVIHDLSWHETLIDVNRLMRSSRIEDALRSHYTPDVIKTMLKTIEDVTIGEIGAQNVFEAAINHVRVGATIAGLGWNLTTSFLQPLGLTQSMARIGVKWVAKGASRWLRDAASMENTVTWIGEKSDFMRLRSKTQQREINEIRNTINKGGVMTAIEESFFYFIGKMQLVADVPTWLGMYEKAMSLGHEESKAIAMADQAVLDSQGGGQIKDLSQIQRGSPLMKLWTNFYSFFNVTYNQLTESINETRLVGISRLPMLAVDVLLLTSLPATLAFLMKQALKGGEDKDDEKLVKELINENLGYMLGMMVGVRELGSMIQGTYGYNGAAGTRFFSDMGKLVKQAQQGEVDEALLKALNNVMGSLLHYPAGQVQRTVTGIQALADGSSTNPLAPLVGLPPKQ
ncbi:crystallin beta/gamma motif-containing protein [uncultured Caudovirales phage]|uniref:Crystallin beta/gamma motif-containing protein n=1 Tax=uncultured Caudovirales phage TaxID=2100421 RepID=A0A6J5KRC8_9CAUD|nr:crystallin beta/gamma motif-containing protein [uncultured Caudovirales phage]